MFINSIPASVFCGADSQNIWHIFAWVLDKITEAEVAMVLGSSRGVRLAVLVASRTSSWPPPGDGYLWAPKIGAC
jgi:hypothetical protein